MLIHPALLATMHCYTRCVVAALCLLAVGADSSAEGGGSHYDQIIHKKHSHASLEEGQVATRVLIVGTSYTKSLAKELQQLSRQGERPLHVEQRIGPGRCQCGT